MRVREAGTAIVFAALMFAAGCGDGGGPAQSVPTETELEPVTIEQTDCENPTGNFDVRFCRRANGLPENATLVDRFDSLGEAADFAEEATGQPAPLPRGMRLIGDVHVEIFPDKSVQLTLTQGDRPLVLRYGKAIGFDGCELPEVKSVDIRGVRGLIAAHDVPGKNDYYELVWPATEGGPVGTLGLSGQLPRDQILTYAANIEDFAEEHGTGSTARGC